jgi:hypothetical protein
MSVAPAGPNGTTPRTRRSCYLFNKARSKPYLRASRWAVQFGWVRQVVSYLTDELVQMGHDVTLFASGDSVSGANLVRCVPTALRLDAKVSDPIPYYMLMLDRVRELCTSTSISFTFHCFDQSPIVP